jgi:ELWxxDGT repeat protein
MPTNNRVIFTAYTPTIGTALWVTDGTNAGTTLLKDIRSTDLASPAPSGFVNFGTNVVFSATDAPHGRELWITDGSTAGTSLLKDINPGPTSGVKSGFYPASGGKVFIADNGTIGGELWVSDGTAVGTSVLLDIHPGASSSYPQYITPFGGKLLFQAQDGVTAHFQALWITDGTAAGTSLLVPTSGGLPQVIRSNITDLGANGRAVFTASEGTHGSELWVTDGTNSGTSLLKDINTVRYQSSQPGTMALLGTSGRAVFAATTNGPGTAGTQLWVTDGTVAGTSSIRNFSGGYNNGLRSGLAANSGAAPVTLGNKAVFLGTDAGVTGLWATDGTAAGTTILTTAVTSMGSIISGTHYFQDFGTKELFWSGSGLGSSLWVTDGTAGGTSQLSSVATGGASGGFGVVGGRAVFRAYSTFGSTTDNELWVTNGTAAGTYMLDNINTVNVSGSYHYSSPGGFTLLGNKVLFSATDGTGFPNHGRELWITDGFFSGTSLLKDINTPYASSNPSGFAAVVLPCFAAGTRVETKIGPVAVEMLRAGDLVRTASGGLHPVRWIGHRSIAIARHPKPDDIRPIRIAPHAFAQGQPHTALRLSPDHAVYADGVLIPVRYLVNGTSIARERPDQVTYYHVELADADGGALHDVILAEGLACESFLDTGNRDAFSNGGSAEALHPNFARDVWARAGCARLVVDGAEVVALRSWLLERAAALGHDRSTDPAIGFSIDGRPANVVADGDWRHLDLPVGARTLYVHSRTAMPAEITDAETDTRVLGVAVVALMLDHAPAALDGDRLGSGWHAAEPDLRWTNGCATIDVRGTARVSLAVHLAPAYWQPAPLARGGRAA